VRCASARVTRSRRATIRHVPLAPVRPRPMWLTRSARARDRRAALPLTSPAARGRTSAHVRRAVEYYCTARRSVAAVPCTPLENFSQEPTRKTTRRWTSSSSVLLLHSDKENLPLVDPSVLQTPSPDPSETSKWSVFPKPGLMSCNQLQDPYFRAVNTSACRASG
jgi:hypothetical protein